MHLSPDALKALAGGFTALASWSAGAIAQTVESLPSWVKAADTPLVVLGLGYGIIHLWRELGKERNARIADRDSFVTRMREDADKAEESRKELLTATNEQTGVIKALVRELRLQGLHKPKDGED
jgi:hypothetical protein